MELNRRRVSILAAVAGVGLLCLSLLMSLVFDYWQASRRFDEGGMDTAARVGAQLQREKVMFSVVAMLLCAEPDLDRAAATIQRLPGLSSIGQLNLYGVGGAAHLNHAVACPGDSPATLARLGAATPEPYQLLHEFNRAPAPSGGSDELGFRMTQQLALGRGGDVVQWALLRLDLLLNLGDTHGVRYQMLPHAASGPADGVGDGPYGLPDLYCRFALDSGWDLAMWRPLATSEISKLRLGVIGLGGLVLLVFGALWLRRHQQYQRLRSRERDTLIRRAERDPLTGLPNRTRVVRYLDQVIQVARKHDRHVGVLFIDLDGFKAVNDQHGHKIGDELLIIVARRLANAMARGDLVARLGGDEFVVVVPRVGDRAALEVVMERLREALLEPFVIDDRELKVGASIGMAMAPEDGGRGHELLVVADSQMYGDKSRRRAVGNLHPFPDRRKK